MLHAFLKKTSKTPPSEIKKAEEIAYKILQLRKNAGISQSELAKKIGAKQSESGERMLVLFKNCLGYFLPSVMSQGNYDRTKFYL